MKVFMTSFFDVFCVSDIDVHGTSIQGYNSQTLCLSKNHENKRIFTETVLKFMR